MRPDIRQCLYRLILHVPLVMRVDVAFNLSRADPIRFQAGRCFAVEPDSADERMQETLQEG